MRLIDADYLKNLPFERWIHTDFGDTAIPIEEIDNAPTVPLPDFKEGYKQAIIDGKTNFAPCYQTTSCLDCKMYDKENHHCPRFCEVIRELIKEAETNNDLISREDLKKALHNFFDGKVIDEPTYILRDVFCYIDNAPTVESRIEYGTDGQAYRLFISSDRSKWGTE